MNKVVYETSPPFSTFTSFIIYNFIGINTSSSFSSEINAWRSTQEICPSRPIYFLFSYQNLNEYSGSLFNTERPISQNGLADIECVVYRLFLVQPAYDLCSGKWQHAMGRSHCSSVHWVFALRKSRRVTLCGRNQWVVEQANQVGVASLQSLLILTFNYG